MIKIKTYTEDRDQPNTAFLFYKKYFTDDAIIKGAYEFESVNRNILDTQLRLIEKTGATHCFEAETIYPGLVTGIGHVHEIGSIPVDEKNPMNNPFKIGFEFDYTTGMPLLPGSSIKGVLRSAFPNSHLKPGKNPYNKEKKEYITSLLKNNLSINDEIDVDKLEKEIFDGIDSDGNPKSIYKRDIFFDAVPVSSKEKLFGSDYITHHEQPLKNPNPVMFLKIMPQVVYEFRFKLHKGLIDEKTKKNLFELIIKDLGAGAKTNVGYGQFQEPVSNHNKNEYTVEEPEDKTQYEKLFNPEEYVIVKNYENYKKNTVLTAEIIDIIQNHLVFRIDDDQLVKPVDNVKIKLEEQKIKAEKKRKVFVMPDLIIGTKVGVRINQDFTLDEMNFTILPAQ